MSRTIDRLAKAGLWGMLALALIAVTAWTVWLFLQLPRVVQLLLVLALLGWGMLNWTHYRVEHQADRTIVANETPAPRAQLVKLPTEVRRAQLVNIH